MSQTWAHRKNTITSNREPSFLLPSLNSTFLSKITIDPALVTLFINSLFKSYGISAHLDPACLDSPIRVGSGCCLTSWRL